MRFHLFGALTLAVATASTASGQGRHVHHTRLVQRHPFDTAVVTAAPTPSVLSPNPSLSPNPTLSPNPMLSPAPTVLPSIIDNRRDDTDHSPDDPGRRRGFRDHRDLPIYTIIEPAGSLPSYITSSGVPIPGADQQDTYTVPTYQVPTYTIPSYP